MTTTMGNPTAAEAATSIRNGEMSSVSVVETCLARCAERDGEVGAWAFLDPELALAQAAERDAALAAGATPGPLHGLPVGIKDIVDTADMPTECGSRSRAGRRPERDAAMVALLRDAGAVIMGKTVTTEFALSAPAKTRNPHAPDRTPGGSSSGSAAAVADRMVPLAVGSQTGGSMLRPASYCGVHGFKPTFGTIPRTGMAILARRLDHPGVYGRSLDDLALIADVMMRKDPTDFEMRGHPKAAIGEALARPLDAPPRLAFVRGKPWEKAAPYMDELFAPLVERLGPAIEEVALGGPFDMALDCHSLIMNANLYRNLAQTVAESAADMDPITVERVGAGRNIPAAAYIASLELADVVGRAAEALFERHDVLVTAAAPGEAPGPETTGDAVMQQIWTLLGTPALSLPLLDGPNGLPVGVQVIARKGGDAELFRVARWIEAAAA